jgi:hypothetical protein
MKHLRLKPAWKEHKLTVSMTSAGVCDKYPTLSAYCVACVLNERVGSFSPFLVLQHDSTFLDGRMLQ